MAGYWAPAEWLTMEDEHYLKLERFGEDFVRVVVVMLTTSMHPNDRSRSEAYSVVQDYFSKLLPEEQVQKVAAMVAELTTLRARRPR